MTVFIVQKLESPEKPLRIVFATLDDALMQVRAIHDSGNGSGAIGIFEVPVVQYDDLGIITEMEASTKE